MTAGPGTGPNSARIYAHWLGGKDTYAADREAAEKIASLCPAVRECAVANRLYLASAIRQAAEAGIGQFADIGCGFPLPPASPGAPNTHEIAGPAAAVAYVDCDPLVVSHALALMKGPRVAAFTADLRDTATVAAGCMAAGFDFAKPVCLLFGAVLHFLDPAAAAAAVGRYVPFLAAGSRVVITVRCCEDPVLAGQIRDAYEPEAIYDYTPAVAADLFAGAGVKCGGVKRVSGLHEAGQDGKPPRLYFAGGTGIV